jgi:hypothetical protein
MGTELIFVVTRLFCCCGGSGIIGWISIQSYPFNLNACGAAVNSVNSDNRLADACGRASVRCVRASSVRAALKKLARSVQPTTRVALVVGIYLLDQRTAPN